MYPTLPVVTFSIVMKLFCGQYPLAVGFKDTRQPADSPSIAIGQSRQNDQKTREYPSIMVET